MWDLPRVWSTSEEYFLGAQVHSTVLGDLGLQSWWESPHDGSWEQRWKMRGPQRAPWGWEVLRLWCLCLASPPALLGLLTDEHFFFSFYLGKKFLYNFIQDAIWSGWGRVCLGPPPPWLSLLIWNFFVWPQRDLHTEIQGSLNCRYGLTAWVMPNVSTDSVCSTHLSEKSHGNTGEEGTWEYSLVPDRRKLLGRVTEATLMTSYREHICAPITWKVTYHLLQHLQTWWSGTHERAWHLSKTAP